MGHFPLFIHFKTIILYSVNPHPDTGTCFIQNIFQKIYAPSSFFQGRGGGIYILNETSACVWMGVYRIENNGLKMNK
jgi:hypothetical protein